MDRKMQSLKEDLKKTTIQNLSTTFIIFSDSAGRKKIRQDRSNKIVSTT